MIFNAWTTEELDSFTLREIARVKDTCWEHGISSQIKWIQENCLADDLHILMRADNGSLAGYCAITKVCAQFDQERAELCGLGGVCISHQLQGRGLGGILVNYATDLILHASKRGILLCREGLVGFYGSHGWKNLKFDDARVGDQPYGLRIMTTGGESKSCSSVLVDRNF